MFGLGNQCAKAQLIDATMRILKNPRSGKLLGFFFLYKKCYFKIKPNLGARLMSHCPQKPPSSWKEVLNEIYQSTKGDGVLGAIILMWVFLIAIFLVVKFFTS